jgi:hypothetical protein
MKKALATAALAGSAFCISAAGQQPCTPEALASKPGFLRASKLVGSAPGLSPAEVARARATLMQIHQKIAAGYNPVGLVGDYSFSFSGGPTGAVFGYTLYLLKYNCDPTSADRSKFYIGTDTPTSVRIRANVIDDYSLSAADTSDNTFRGYLFMPSLPKKVDTGIYYLGDNPGGISRENQKEYTWLITYDDQLPFTVLTRKDYLLAAQERLAKSIRENGNSSGYYDQFVKRVDEYLRKSDAELSQPAIVSRAEEERFTGFVADGSRGSTYLLRHNPKYYRKGLPKSAAQFFTVRYGVFEGEPLRVYQNNIEAVKKTLDLKSLRPLLGQ